MAHIVGTAKVALKKQLKFSSSVSKNGIFVYDGRSVSIFRIGINDCIKPWFDFF